MSTPVSGRALAWIAAGTLLLSGAAGTGAALWVLRGAPEAPAAAAALPGSRLLDLEKENLTLREEAKRNRLEAAEARLQAAAAKAIPRSTPVEMAGDLAPDDPLLRGLDAETQAKFRALLQFLREREAVASAAAQREFVLASLRAKLDRGWKGDPLPEDRREEVLKILADGIQRMETLAREDPEFGGGGSGGGLRSTEVQAAGEEIRRRLGEILTPEQVRAVEEAVGPPVPAEAAKPR